ncbi:sigma-54 interaction domain-containing protein [Lentibacillus cibarius]|uniref:sigma-54 interaction domain-containing protein n=1 Tax=Lentibacillus cibarius TaxID=2583219 RepID=UPI0014869E78|nr:sigma 54-interacting transcriptional regulator [Lentibacillus cibarius]
MQIDANTIKNLADYDNILVVDKEGKTLFYDLADLNVLSELGQRPEEFIGKHVTTFYQDLTEENSTVMNVLRNGKPLSRVRQEMTTIKGNEIISISSTYPITEIEQVVGAIEFSKRYYLKENIQSLHKYAGHKVYRKNNTIYTIDDLITANSRMESIKQHIRKISRTSSSVLLNGRTGTGKEIVAQAIHNLSDRYAQQFISLNCSAVPESLMESTLFGTTKGSFTGSEDMPGVFEQADGGTLFLDEINSLPVPLQVKLLKAVEEKAVRRIGGKKPIPLNIRIVSATNEEPDKLLAEKRLREDLFYRLSVVELNLPELVERKEDIPVLLDYFINFYNTHMNIRIDGAEADVLETFKRYDWPGNVRELKNAVETAYNSVSSRMITMDDIPRRICKAKQMSKPAHTGRGASDVSLKEAVENYEQAIIAAHLKEANGVIAETARRLDMSKQSLKYKINKYELM